MNVLGSPQSGLSFVSNLTSLDRDDRPLRRGHANGTLRRVRRGVYVDGALWKTWGELERYRARILAVLGTRRRNSSVAYLSAAAVWGFPVIEAWPHHVDVLVDPTSQVRSKNGVRVHRDTVRQQDIRQVGDLLVTSPARTLADLARTLPFEDAVVMLDHALNPERAAPTAFVAKKDVIEALEFCETRRGLRKARLAIEFSDGRSGSVAETCSRVAIHELGFPPPLLQVVHRLRSGSVAKTDFEWPEYRQIGEVDGAGKYLKSELMNGRTSGQIVYEEKRREDELRAEGNGVSRWGWRESRRRDLLCAILTNAGLPIIQPRTPFLH